MSPSPAAALSIYGAVSDNNGTRSLTLTSSDSSGILILGSSSNTYGGGTTISSGTLRLGVSNAIPVGGAVLVNGTLDLHGLDQSIGTLNGSGTIANSQPGLSTLTVSGGGSFSGTISDPAIGPLVALQVSGGTLNLSGTNTYSGGTSISGGTLQLGSSGTLPSGTARIAVGKRQFGSRWPEPDRGHAERRQRHDHRQQRRLVHADDQRRRLDRRHDQR